MSIQRWELMAGSWVERSIRGDYVTHTDHAASLAAKDAEIAALRQRCGRLAELAMRTHYTCEDTWYSCPKSEDGCADDFKTGCTCGADENNAEVQAIINNIRPDAGEESSDG